MSEIEDDEDGPMPDTAEGLEEKLRNSCTEEGEWWKRSTGENIVRSFNDLLISGTDSKTAYDAIERVVTSLRNEFGC